MEEKRYQECNLIVKFWRCRWYLTIPFMVIYAIWKEGMIWHKAYIPAIWGTWKARMHIKMNYYITMEEMKEHLKSVDN